MRWPKWGLAVLVVLGGGWRSGCCWPAAPGKSSGLDLGGLGFGLVVLVAWLAVHGISVAPRGELDDAVSPGRVAGLGGAGLHPAGRGLPAGQVRPDRRRRRAARPGPRRPQRGAAADRLGRDLAGAALALEGPGAGGRTRPRDRGAGGGLGAMRAGVHAVRPDGHAGVFAARPDGLGHAHRHRPPAAVRAGLAQPGRVRRHRHQLLAGPPAMTGTPVSNHIRRLRFERGGMTQEALAREVGVTRQTIIALEAGKYAPSLELAFRIARAFGAGVEDVFSWD